MIKIMLVIVTLVLSACGGGGGSNVGGEDGDNGASAGWLAPGQAPAEGDAAGPAMATHEAAFGNTAPIPGMGKSARFDEDGYLIGVYAIPYVPAKGKK